MNKSIFTIIILLLFTFSSCRKDQDKLKGDYTGYDVVLVAGQSNTHFGFGYDSILDQSRNNIFQLGRFEELNYQIIPAQEPLEHHSKKKNKIGFALTFAKLYADAFLDPTRALVIIPCGKAGSGFINNKWNKYDYLYDDAVARCRFVLNNFQDSKLIAVLWQQGEDDVGNLNYQTDLDEFLLNLQFDFGDASIPIILGGMMPSWVDKKIERQNIQEIIKETPNRVNQVGYADPSFPLEIKKVMDTSEHIHYDAPGMREMGYRYFAEYIKLRK